MVVVGIGGIEKIDEFQRDGAAVFEIALEGLEIVRRDAGHQPDLEPSVGHLIGDGDLFGEAQRMMQRHDVAHAAEADFFGAGGGADGVEAGRRHPAFIGPEMMFDAKAVIETGFVGDFQFAPKLLETFGRCHAGLAPDMGEMGKFHGGNFLRCCAASIVGKFITCRPVDQRNQPLGGLVWRLADCQSRNLL